jgi:histidinol-phosphate aminotransferase
VLAEAQGIVVNYAETDPDFRIPFGELSASGTRLLLITNPNAPTGILEPLAAIEACVCAFPGVVVVDEAYIDFSDNPDAATALSLVGKYDNLLVARTFSKSFALCGIRAGYCFGNPDLVAALVLAKDSYNLDMIAQPRPAAAKRDCAWMEAMPPGCGRPRAHAARRSWNGLHRAAVQANFSLSPAPGSEAAASAAPSASSKSIFRHFPHAPSVTVPAFSIGTDRRWSALHRPDGTAGAV